MRRLVFLTGCGRSGTTILGTLLAQHPDVTFLNDRFDIWIDALPRADIWGMLPDHSPDPAQCCSIALGADALDEPGVRDAVREIRTRLDVERGDAHVLVEKLAINNFRLGFLHAAFPEAAFINITRHGVEVAASIARKIECNQWFGHNDRKWTLLCAHADHVGLGALARSCASPLERGLLEWRMSVDAANGFFSSTIGVEVAHMTYEQMLRAPGDTARVLTSFLGLCENMDMIQWADRHIARQSTPAAQADALVVESTERIAGSALRRLGYALPASENDRCAAGARTGSMT
jgi:Sulfotransferase family